MKHVAIVTEQFWPHSGPTELALADVASCMVESGNKVSIVTARSGKDWPSYVEYRGIPVHRIARYSAGPWASYRYARAFSKFFLQESNRFDGIVIAGIGIATRAVVKALAGQVPIIVQLGPDALGDGSVPELHTRHWPVLEDITSIVTACPVVAAQLQATVAGVDVQVIETGFRLVETAPSVATQSAARAALSDAHPILAIDTGQPLAISSVPLNRDAGLFDLLDAWEVVIESMPAAKLWVIGDGPHAGAIWKYISRRRLIHSVIMPGFFDEATDIVHAADLYIHSARTACASPGMIQAMAGRCCIVATENDWASQHIVAHETGILTPAKNPTALAEAILLGFREPDLRRRLADQGQQAIEKAHSISNQSNRYLELLFDPANHAVHSNY